MDYISRDHFGENLLTFGEQFQRTFKGFFWKDIFRTDVAVIWGDDVGETSGIWGRQFGMHFMLSRDFWGTGLGTFRGQLWHFGVSLKRMDDRGQF